MRTVLLVTGLGGLAGLGVLDLLAGRWVTGVAALLLSLANGFLLVPQ